MDNDLNRRIAEALGQRVVMRAAERPAHRPGRIVVWAGEIIKRVAARLNSNPSKMGDIAA